VRERIIHVKITLAYSVHTKRGRYKGFGQRGQVEKGGALYWGSEPFSVSPDAIEENSGGRAHKEAGGGESLLVYGFLEKLMK
jgi:hypothetical protein